MVSAASKKLLREFPSEQVMEDTLTGLLNNTDHAAALTGAAYLDHALEILLKARFRTLPTPDEKRMFDLGPVLETVGPMRPRLHVEGPDPFMPVRMDHPRSKHLGRKGEASSRCFDPRLEPVDQNDSSRGRGRRRQ